MRTRPIPGVRSDYLTFAGDFAATGLFIWFAQPHFVALAGIAVSLRHSVDWLRAVVALRMITILIFEWMKVGAFLMRGPVKGSRSSLLNRIVAAVGSFLLLIPVPGTYATSSSLLFASSIVITAAAGFGIWSICHLKSCFAVFPEARGLISSGPYAIVRHPIYLCYWIAEIGIIVTYHSWIFTCLVLVECFFQVWRARNEESALRAVFPEYSAYAAKTPMFFPRLRMGGGAGTAEQRERPLAPDQEWAPASTDSGLRP